jgi:hypothetical protein
MEDAYPILIFGLKEFEEQMKSKQTACQQIWEVREERAPFGWTMKTRYA